MRRFILELLIHTLIIGLLVPLLPGVSIPEATLWNYLGIGLTLSLLSRMLKPALLLLTGQLVIWNVALWVLLVNVVVFVTTGLVVRTGWVLGGPVWLIIDALAVGLVMTLTDALLGFDRPNLNPNDQRQAIWRLVERLPKGLRISYRPLWAIMSITMVTARTSTSFWPGSTATP